MNIESVQNQFGYFGKLPTFGDFIHQLLPLDFSNGFHAWLQQAMASARTALGDDFLPFYLNCPAWKFLLTAGVCGEQAVAGLTIPSVDRVGRYFNFTLATVLPPETNPVAYVLGNRTGFRRLEDAALDILESDFPREELENTVRQAAQNFETVVSPGNWIDEGSGYLGLLLDHALPFSGQSASLLNFLITQRMGGYSIWWSGQQGQSQSQMIVCSGMPSDQAYLTLLAWGETPVENEEEPSYIDKIIAGET